MKPLINTALLKEQLKRFWAIGALTLMAYILFVVLYLYRSVSTIYMLRSQIDGIVRLLSMKNPVMLVVGVATPMAAVITMFAYLFQPRTTTAIHALPVNKRQLYFTNILAGLILMAVPLLILCAVLLIPIRYPHADIVMNGTSWSEYGWVVSLPQSLLPNGLTYGDTINTLPVVAGFFARTLLTQIFNYAVILLAVSLAGNAVVSILCAGVLPFIPVGLFALTQIIGVYYVFGFSTQITSNYLSKVLKYSHPFAFVSCYSGPNFSVEYPFVFEPSVSTRVVLLFIVYSLTAVALFALAYGCMRSRKQERAGDSIVFNPVRNVLIFLLSLTGMIMMGLFFMSLLNSIAALYAGYVVGFILTYFIAQMIAEKAVNVLYKVKYIVVYGGVMIGLFVAVSTVTRLDWLGYEQYLPAEDEVVGVYLNSPYQYFMMHERLFSFIEDRDTIKDTLNVHQDILNDKKELHRNYHDWLAGRSGYNGHAQTITYKLNDGKVIVRDYWIPFDYMDRPDTNLTALMDTDIVILSEYHSFKTLSEVDSVGFDYQTVDRSYETAIVTKPNDIRDVLEEVKKDIILTHWEQKERNRLRQQGQPFESAEDRLTGYTHQKNQDYNYEYFNLEDYSNTYAWLTSHGYLNE